MEIKSYREILELFTYISDSGYVESSIDTLEEAAKLYALQFIEAAAEVNKDSILKLEEHLK